jgi:hypothetical protein
LTDYILVIYVQKLLGSDHKTLPSNGIHLRIVKRMHDYCYVQRVPELNPQRCPEDHDWRRGVVLGAFLLL